jgi:hypothetical protein
VPGDRDERSSNVSNLTPAATKPPRGACRIETVRAGESVTVWLTGRSAQRTNAYCARVVDVDCRAVRLDLCAERFDWWWQDREGQVVIPWSRIESIDVRGAA